VRSIRLAWSLSNSCIWDPRFEIRAGRGKYTWLSTNILVSQLAASSSQAIQQSYDNTFEAEAERWIDIHYNFAALSDGDTPIICSVH